MAERIFGKKKDLATELEALKKERARARNSNKPFDSTKNQRIHAIAAEMEEIDEADALRTKDADEEATRAGREADALRLQKNVEDAGTLLAAYLDDIALIQTATERIGRALQRIEGYAVDLTKVYSAITGQNDQVLLSPINIQSRLFGRMANVLLPQFPPLLKYQMPEQEMQRMLPAWRDEERRRFENAYARPIRKLQARIAELRASSVIAA